MDFKSYLQNLQHEPTPLQDMLLNRLLKGELDFVYRQQAVSNMRQKHAKVMDSIAKEYSLILIADLTNRSRTAGVRVYEDVDTNGASGYVWYDYGGRSLSYAVLATTQARGRMVFDSIHEYAQPPAAKDSTLYGLVNGNMGITTQAMGSINQPLVRTNYTPNVLEDYDFVLEQLDNPRPNGRIILLSGPPGSGKTSMVKAFITEAKGCRFILIPSNLVPELSGVSVLKTLINQRRLAEDVDDELADDLAEDGIEFKPSSQSLVLVVEDADACLVPRGADNMSAISSLLNVTDGLIGAALDIKIIATTNAALTDIDPAIERPGRLCRKFHVDSLSREDARAALEVIDSTVTLPEGERFTLAELYALKKRDKVVKPKTRKVGFGF